MNVVVIEAVLVTIVLLVLTIYALYSILVKRDFLWHSKQNEKLKIRPEIILWREKYKKAINVVTTLLISIIIIPGHIYVTVPLVKDFKYVISQDYLSFEGIIVSDVKSTISSQSVVIKSGEKEMELTITAGNKQKGDYIKVHYLPSLKMGAIY